MSVKIYPVADDFVASQGDTWITGIFVSEYVARACAALPPSELDELWTRVLERGDKVITEGDLT